MDSEWMAMDSDGRVLDNGKPAPLGVIRELERRTRIQAPAIAATWPLSSVKLFFCSGGTVTPRPLKQAAAQLPGNFWKASHVGDASTILDKAVEDSNEQDGWTLEDLVMTDGQTVFRGRVLDNGEPAPLGVIQELERRTRIQAPADAATWPLSSVKLFFCSGGAVRPRPSKQAAAQFPGNFWKASHVGDASTILDKAVEESDEQDGRTEEDLVLARARAETSQSSFKTYLSEATEYVGEPLLEFESGVPGAMSLDKFNVEDGVRIYSAVIDGSNAEWDEWQEGGDD